ncbi:Ig-like domain-containing protein [Dawidia soli]|uniref:Ig-like domain-containing protein n=1 Tax=Dawidia soli TaxID=2782352 RepID=A0AAP2D609_9BACT|nr:Ig-like domain-containing protein [Dawidia soli]MBT1685181.1 Ig-like domain-containing protein [Dawidia soli]
MILRKALPWFVYSLFILSCARQTAPTGGPKDTIPPVLVKAVPYINQTNFKDKELTLTFDEALLLNNPKEQIIVTPDIQKKYDINVKKNVVHMTLDTELKDSTTYTFNFRDAIQDITEKNPAKNIKLAISTGPYVDSLIIQGLIYDPLRPVPVKEATVALFESDTFNIFQHTPAYITKTNETGLYALENLKPGTYYVFAIDDRNRNLIADSKTEQYGFIGTPIELKRNQKQIDIPIIKLDTRQLKLTNSRPYNTYFNIKLSKNLATYKLTSDSSEWLFSAFGEDPANIRVYNTFDNTDSTAIRLTARDSIYNRIDTVIYAKFTDREVKPEAFSSKTDGFKVFARKGFITGQVQFSKPLLEINYDSILYQIDSAKVVTFSKGDIQWDSLHNRITIQKTFDAKLLIEPEPVKDTPKPKPVTTEKGQSKQQPKKVIKNRFYLGNAAFISIERDSSKASEETLRPITLEETGVISTQIQTKEAHFIVQLLDKSNNVVKVIHDKKNAVFEDVIPAEYQIRLIIDYDGNGEWSPGNFFRKVEPEPTIYYLNEKDNPIINLKANWEIGPLLITY